ncbi:conjugative transposon protein TraK [Longitalea luteola]|uniref:conjugative transposon protein TraK n=1 Tax=Longitalea luteola TaxID=2812563 RepID=UPI001A962EB4|nr:conjugative transposon protein TraK [Longitalea luteola]
MFKQLKNIDSAFRHIKLFSIFLMLACVCIAGYSLYTSEKVLEKANQRIYILANGKVLEAVASDRKENIPVEARDHVRMFHHYFFSLDPDDQVIQANITKALYLADQSAKIQYDNLKENSYYSNLISGNISQEITIDSVMVDVNKSPIYFQCYAQQKIIRPSTIVTRSLVTEGYLRSVARSDHNPHGFLIERWKTLENRDLKTENR